MRDQQFRQIQYQFGAHMRDPAHHEGPPGVEDRRLKIYRDLLYKNVEGFIANAFPVLRQLTDDGRWHAMIRDYYSRHRARTPLFPKMPQEFLRYLADERQDTEDPPFMRELAHYEWLEAEVLFDTREIDDVVVDHQFELPDGCPVANPVIRLQTYEFPVHRIGPGFEPALAPAQPTYLVVFRRRNDSVGFMELNAVSARLLDLIVAAEGRSARSLLLQIAEELAHPDTGTIVDSGVGILQSFFDKDIILGTVSAHA